MQGRALAFENSLRPRGEFFEVVEQCVRRGFSAGPRTVLRFRLLLQDSFEPASLWRSEIVASGLPQQLNDPAMVALIDLLTEMRRESVRITDRCKDYA